MFGALTLLANREFLDYIDLLLTTLAMNDPHNQNTPKGLTRRKFLNKGIQGYTGLTISQGLSVSLIGTLSCADTQAKTAHGACYHDCPDTCSWTVTAEKGAITEFGPSKTNPFTAGKLCSKMDKFPMDVTFHPDRILTPLKRAGAKGEGKFEPVSWETAIRDVGARLQQTIKYHGSESILPYCYAGTEGLVQRDSIGGRFFAKLGASKLDGTICGDAAVAGVTSVYGQTSGVLPEDIIYSRYIVFWGTNPVVSNQHVWPLAEKARANGAKIIVVDPFKSATAMLADQHIQPMPGTDVVLALSMMQVIIEEQLTDQDYIQNNTTGFSQLSDYVQEYQPEAAAEITGLDPELIRTFAREYASAEIPLIRMLIGMEHQANGANAFRAVSMLPALTGAWKNRGGGFMHMTYEFFGQALNWERLSVVDTIANPDARIINMVQIGAALNDTENPLYALFVYNSNPAVIAPDQNRIIAGLKRENLFTVVLEHFMTDTARYADYVFPATTQLEHWDLMSSWGQTYLNINEPVIPPLGESKPNTEFFRLLSSEMGFMDDYMYESDIDIIKQTLKSDHPFMEGISFNSLRKNGWARLNIPDGWMPFSDGKFNTPSGKIELYSRTLEEAGMSPLPVYSPVLYSEEHHRLYPLKILTIKSTKNFLNTSHANVDHLIKNEGVPKLDIHPEDARARGISDGSHVEVYNANGRVLLTAHISDRVAKGVACMPQGFWPSLMDGGSSANALTSDRLTDMGGGAALQETIGEVRLISA